MNVPTCYGCYLRKYNGERCPLLATKLAAVKGAGLTSIKFKCDVRPGLFKPGERVKFTVMERDAECDQWGDRGPTFEPMTFTGWVWKTKGLKVYVVSDETDLPVLKFYPSQLKRVFGGVRRCCIHCQKPEGLFDTVKPKNGGDPHPYECRGHSVKTGTWEEGWVIDPCEYGGVEQGKEEAK